jgi:hypothetical protein
MLAVGGSLMKFEFVEVKISFTGFFKDKNGKLRRRNILSISDYMEAIE